MNSLDPYQRISIERGFGRRGVTTEIAILQDAIVKYNNAIVYL